MLTATLSGGVPSEIDAALMTAGKLPCLLSWCATTMLADWIEQALEMDGESYLRTPEEELPWIVLYNMDVYCALIVLLVVIIVSMGMAVTRYLSRVSTSPLTRLVVTSEPMKKKA